MLYQSPEFKAALAVPATPSSQGRTVELRLLAAASLSLHRLTDSQLAALPTGRLEFHARAICEINPLAPWIRFTFPEDINAPTSMATEEDWLQTAPHVLVGLHEWVMLETRMRGSADIDISWEHLSRERRITAAHTFFQVIDLVRLFLGIAERQYGKLPGKRSRLSVRKPRTAVRRQHFR